MARDIDPATLAAAQAEVVRIAWLLRLEYASQTSYVSSTDFTIAWGPDGGAAQDFLGVGSFLAIQGIDESAEQSSRNTVLQLSAVPVSAVSQALDPPDYVGRRVTIWLALLDASHRIIGQPVRELIGLIDAQDIEIDGDPPTATLQVTLTDRRSRWSKPSNRRYSNEQQQARFSGDRGLEFIADLVDKEIAWPEEFA